MGVQTHARVRVSVSPGKNPGGSIAEDVFPRLLPSSCFYPLLNLRRYCHYQFSKQYNPIPFPVFPIFSHVPFALLDNLGRRGQTVAARATGTISLRNLRRSVFNFPSLLLFLLLKPLPSSTYLHSVEGIYLANTFASGKLRKLISREGGFLYIVGY